MNHILFPAQWQLQSLFTSRTAHTELAANGLIINFAFTTKRLWFVGCIKRSTRRGDRDIHNLRERSPFKHFLNCINRKFVSRRVLRISKAKAEEEKLKPKPKPKSFPFDKKKNSFCFSSNFPVLWDNVTRLAVGDLKVSYSALYVSCDPVLSIPCYISDESGFYSTKLWEIIAGILNS